MYIAITNNCGYPVDKSCPGATIWRAT